MTIQNKIQTNLQQRVVSGVLGGAVLLGAVLWRAESFVIVFSLIAFFSVWEFIDLLKQRFERLPRLYTLFSAALLLWSHALHLLGVYETWAWLWLLPILLLSLPLLLLWDEQQSQPIEAFACYSMSWLYILLPFVLYMRLAFVEVYQPWVAMGFLLLLWANDTIAYFVGKSLGKRKLFERISPKKTWEGTLAGWLAALGLAMLLSVYVSVLSPLQWIGMALLIGILGTYGDLAESMFKRSLGVKDSGKWIPGHGGFLDRFDALLLAAPAVAIWLAMTSFD